MSLLLLFPHPAAAGHTLAANDVESISEVSSPTIGQVHALLANAVESASEVSSPSLSVVGEQPVAGGGGGFYVPKQFRRPIKGLSLRSQPFKDEGVEELVEELVEQAIEEIESVEEQAPEIRVPGQDIARLATTRALARQGLARKIRKTERLSQRVAEAQLQARITEMVRQRREFFRSDQEDIQAILFILGELL